MRWLALVTVLAVILAPGRPGTARAQQFDLNLKLTIDRTAYEPGAAITFTLTVSNVTTSRIFKQFATSQRFDLVVQAGAAEVSRWSDSHVFTPLIEPVSWAPGETKTYADTWIPLNRVGPSSVGAIFSPTLAPGLYTIHPELANTGTHPIGEALPLVIGQPYVMDAGCTPIPNGFHVTTTAAFFARTLDPVSALHSIWRYDAATNRYAGFSPTPNVPPNDLVSINPGDQLVMCLSSPGALLVPS
jgi:hypothetical protein